MSDTDTTATATTETVDDTQANTGTQAAETATTGTATTTAADGTDTKADTAKADGTDWKALARKHEDEKKANGRKLDAVLKALGMEVDKKTVDPAEIAKALETERGQGRSLRVENAILRSASKNGADPDLLTDSRKFMAEVEALDPTSDTFTDDLAKAIKAAVKANPALAGKATVSTTSGAEHNGTTTAAVEMDPKKLAAQAADRTPKVRIFNHSTR